MRVLVKLIKWFVVIGLIIVYMCCFRFVEVDGESMQPSYADKTTLLVRRGVTPERNDVVAVYSSTLQEDLCKRVIALEGDSVEIKKGKVYVNDILLEEPFNEDNSTDFAKEIVPKGRVFVLGDNRNNSLDSRKLGAIPIENIRAVVLIDLHISYPILHSILILILVYLFIKCLYDMVKVTTNIEIYNPTDSTDYDIHLKHLRVVHDILDLKAPYVLFVTEYVTSVVPEKTQYRKYNIYDSEKIKQEYNRLKIKDSMEKLEG